jgi:hypothetical protein
MSQALASANTLLDFTVATYLAAFQVDSYQGTNILSYVQNYKNVPDYALQGSNIANAALWLNNSGELSGSDTNAILKALASDPNVDLGAKLYIEQVQYQSGEL